MRMPDRTKKSFRRWTSSNSATPALSGAAQKAQAPDDDEDVFPAARRAAEIIEGSWRPPVSSRTLAASAGAKPR